MTIAPDPQTGRARIPLLRPAIGLVVLGVVLGLACGARVALHAAPVLFGGISAPLLTVPEDGTRFLEPAEYALLERTGPETADGGGSAPARPPTTLTPADVTVTGPDGGTVAVRPTGGGTETYTRDGTVFTAFGYVTAPAYGEYTISVTGPPGTQVLVNQSIASGVLHGMVPWLIGGVGGGLLFGGGLLLLLVALVRRPR